MSEQFNTQMGKVYFCYEPYCIGCDRFEPFARETCKTDNDGKVIWTADNQTIRDGVSIKCEHWYLCQNVARELAKRLKEN